jgi:hypothetical protein
MNDNTLIDAPLVPDPRDSREMGAADTEQIADEDLKGSRLLLVRRAVEAVEISDAPGGIIELGCTFQPGFGTRFTYAQVVLKFTSPDGIRIADIEPRKVPEQEPVKFTVDRKGQLGIEFLKAKAGFDASKVTEYSIYHCAVVGSGEGTQLARWNFNENPYRKDGLGSEQSLILTCSMTGLVTGTVSVTARLARSGFGGTVDAIRDLIMGPGPERKYPIAFDIPKIQPLGSVFRFVRLS